MGSRRFRALTTAVRVAWDDEALAEPLRRLVGTHEPLAAGAAPALEYELRAAGVERPELRRDGATWPTPDDLLDLPPIFELDLYRQVVARCRAWTLHGAAVVRGGRALGLVAPSGHGKSTLALALTARGAGYLTDECFAVDEGLLVHGLRRPLSLDRPPPPAPGFEAVGYPVPAREAGRPSTTLVHPPPGRLASATPLGVLVCLRYAPTLRGAELRRLSSGEALERLWASSFNTGEAALAAAATAVERCPVYELESGARAPAVAELEALGA